ncbi:hypothetical protein C8Q70DRAFT_278368 [Cubamyces menziesii]|nr:hypothetical protein C8Q70DRAFT_278368 [Cubamyces menziesii]
MRIRVAPHPCPKVHRCSVFGVHCSMFVGQRPRPCVLYHRPALAMRRLKEARLPATRLPAEDRQRTSLPALWLSGIWCPVSSVQCQASSSRAAYPRLVRQYLHPSPRAPDRCTRSDVGERLCRFSWVLASRIPSLPAARSFIRLAIRLSEYPAIRPSSARTGCSFDEDAVRFTPPPCTPREEGVLLGRTLSARFKLFGTLARLRAHRARPRAASLFPSCLARFEDPDPRDRWTAPGAASRRPLSNDPRRIRDHLPLVCAVRTVLRLLRASTSPTSSGPRDVTRRAAGPFTPAAPSPRRGRGRAPEDQKVNKLNELNIIIACVSDDVVRHARHRP